MNIYLIVILGLLILFPSILLFKKIRSNIPTDLFKVFIQGIYTLSAVLIGNQFLTIKNGDFGDGLFAMAGFGLWLILTYFSFGFVLYKNKEDWDYYVSGTVIILLLLITAFPDKVFLLLSSFI